MNDGPAKLLSELVQLPAETEYVEFKHNNSRPEEIGQTIAALANAAALHDKDRAFMVWGVEDRTHVVLGTDFKPRHQTIKGQELENWLTTQLKPRVHFRIHEFLYDDKPCVIFVIEPASHAPVGFKGVESIRVGSYTKPLREHPEKERVLWKLFARESFETGTALSDIPSQDVLSYLRYWDYFALIQRPIPESPASILETLEDERLIKPSGHAEYSITNLGAVLFADDLRKFPGLTRKAVRVIFYQGKGKLARARELEGQKGYASGFRGLVRFIVDRLPTNEEIREALRREEPVYPEIAIRELVANALIHLLQGERMSNATLRERFKVKDPTTTSRVIKDTVTTGLIKPHDPTSGSKRYASYVPFWA